jgi:hypothetical protein
MPRLGFRQHFEEPILAGRKRSTIRRASCKVRKGDLVTATGGAQTTFAYLKVIEVRRVKVGDLSDRDAREHGGGTGAQLRQAVALTYPGESVFLLVRFRLALPEELT